MRCAGAILLALALAACGVDVEGAPCATPGEITNCPTGQACGADLRCSVKALDCAKCVPGDRRCASGGVETCVAGGACSSWSLSACPAPQTCHDSAAGPSCACPGDPVECHGVAGDSCDASGQLVSCAADAQGCLHVVEQRACPDHEACGGSAGGAACACLPTPAECALTGAFCSDAGTATTCSTTADGCTFLVSRQACAGHQECTAGGGSASCGCIAAPDCSAASGAGRRCAIDGRSVVTCDVDGACPFVSATAACGANQTCDATGATPQCVCNPAPAACEGRTGTSCSAARDAVISCPADGDGCVVSASTAPCGAAEVCGDGVPTCRPRYVVTILSPADGALVGASGVAVKAKVTLATADAAVVPVPAQLTLVDGRSGSVTLARTAQAGLEVTYAGTWVPPSGANGTTFSLAAQVDVAPPVASAAVSVTGDAVAPTLSNDGVRCGSTPCVRDGVLQVAADVHDFKGASVQVALDLDGGPSPVALAVADASKPTLYSAAVPLASYAFPWFRRTAHATLTATDAAGNVTRKTYGFDVSRLRWTYSAGAAVTSPAVMQNGTLLVGVGVAGSSQVNPLRAVSPVDGHELWAAPLGGKPVRSTPSVGNSAVFAGSDDAKLYAVKLDGSGAVITSCGSSSATVTAPALRSLSPDAASAGTAGSLALNNVMVTAYADGTPCDKLSAGNKVASVVVSNGYVAAATETSTLGYITRFVDSGGSLTRDWSAPTYAPHAAPVAVLRDGRVLAASDGGTLYAVDPRSSSGTSLDVFHADAVARESIVVDASGDLIYAGDDNRLHRAVLATRQDAWDSHPHFQATPAGVALVAKDALGGFLVVTFADGNVAVVSDGGAAPQVVWSSAVDGGLAGGPLSFPVVAPPPTGAPASQLPTLYAGSQDGNLYAVVVDTSLDTSSPWPKSHHDLRNSGNASFNVLW
jgi:hypothetical protein